VCGVTSVGPLHTVTNQRGPHRLLLEFGTDLMFVIPSVQKSTEVVFVGRSMRRSAPRPEKYPKQSVSLINRRDTYCAVVYPKLSIISPVWEGEQGGKPGLGPPAVRPLRGPGSEVGPLQRCAPRDNLSIVGMQLIVYMRTCMRTSDLLVKP
jgi:hypothetical protein